MENQNCFEEVDSALTKNGRTALHVAARRGESKCIQILIEHGAKIDAEDKDNATPLALAAWKRHCIAIRQLINAGANKHYIKGNLYKAIKKCEIKEVPVQQPDTNRGTIIVHCKVH